MIPKKRNEVTEMLIDTHKNFIILRGLPGSGKSYLAQKILESAISTGKVGSGAIFTVDQFFTDFQGNYNFRPSLLREYHGMNFDRCVNAFQSGIELMLLPNQNIKRSHYTHYVRAAQLFNYNVEIVEVGGFSDEDIRFYHERCIHNVPLDIIQRSAREFEEDMGEKPVIKIPSYDDWESNIKDEPCSNIFSYILSGGGRVENTTATTAVKS